MSITITDHQLPYESHNLYDVHFYSDDIHTIVTHDPEQLSGWISEIESLNNNNRNLIIGLDVEWRPSFSRYQQNPVAVIQLCVERRCLIFQILQYTSFFNTDEVPIELKRFLGKEEYTFVGVGVGSDVEKLEEDYGVRVGGMIVDLRGLASEVYQMNRLKNAGLKELARVVLERDVEKPKRITMGRWDNPWLTPDQVKYACIDAFVSFEIGKKLNVSGQVAAVRSYDNVSSDTWSGMLETDITGIKDNVSSDMWSGMLLVLVTGLKVTGLKSIFWWTHKDNFMRCFDPSCINICPALRLDISPNTLF